MSISVTELFCWNEYQFFVLWFKVLRWAGKLQRSCIASVPVKDCTFGCYRLVFHECFSMWLCWFSAWQLFFVNICIYNLVNRFWILSTHSFFNLTVNMSLLVMRDQNVKWPWLTFTSQCHRTLLNWLYSTYNSNSWETCGLKILIWTTDKV